MALPQASAVLIPTHTVKAGAQPLAGPRLEISPSVDDIDLPEGRQPDSEEDAASNALPRQQQPKADEMRASSEAEMLELKARVVELDKLQRQQQALLALKDKELAGRFVFWPWVLVALAVLPLVIWWSARGRERRRPSPRSGFAGPAMISASDTSSIDSTNLSQHAMRPDGTFLPPDSPAWHPDGATWQ